MIESFVISFQLKNTYRVNSIIYSIKQLPILKRILSDSLYKNKGLKVFGNIISILMELGSIFLGKLVYLFFMIFFMLSSYKTNEGNTFLHLFTFLTLCGGILNTFMFNPSKDKYYAMVIMNMNAKKYTLSNYYYSLLKVIIGFMPFTIFFGVSCKIPWWLCLLLPVFVVMVKLIVSYGCLLDFEKNKIATNENLPTKVTWVMVGVLLALAYGLPALKITITQNIFVMIFALAFVLGSYSFMKIKAFTQYKKMYKQILTKDNVNFVQKETSTEILRKSVSKQIELDESFTSEKTGFAYFHELFVTRHRKILTKTAKKQTIILSLILVAAIVALSVNPKIGEEINDILLMYLPYFVFVMYLLNRGATVTQAMFLNCDHSMLTYRIYRTPKVILGVFKERLKTLIAINLLAAMVIAIGLPFLLWITGGTDNLLNYAVLFISILAMSIFFSVHYLVMYYLLQPYNVNTEMRSSMFRVVQTITYLVCYSMIQVKLPTVLFGIFMILFSVFYSVISLYLVYKFAPKTFKLRI